MKVSRLFHALMCAGACVAFSCRAGDILINEIMYHPAPAVPEVTGFEWVEIYNKGTNTVPLNGWKFTRGVEFTFTTETLAPGAYLVIAADTAQFHSRYPLVLNVTGNWIGGLGNNGGTLRLENPAGDTEDEVTYASEGTWATRVRGPNDLNHYGWKWFTGADGLGKSAELVNPALPNQYGRNWSDSAANGGTPGAVNSTRTNDTPPLIVEAAHSPVVPGSSDPVVVTAKVLDELTNGVSVSLFYRNASTTSPPGFSSLPMFDDGGHSDGVAGDRVYAATIPAQANNTVIEFYIQAGDAGGKTRTSPGPARQLDLSFAQTANYLYQVDDGPYGGNQPLYRMIMTETERFELDQIGSSGAADSDAEMNGTFISVDGAGTEIRYTCGFRNRGHGSRTARPNNQRINFPNDDTWKGVRGINVNSRYTHVQTFGSAVFQKAGAAMASSRPVQLRINGVNNAQSGSPMFGSYAHNEEVSSEFAADHFPLDSEGNAYRGVRVDPNAAYANLNYYGPNITDCATPPACYTNLYSKQNNQGADDFSDLLELTRVLATTPDVDYTAEVRRVFDVEAAMLYFAVNTLGDNNETSLSNGEGDDYAMYRGVLDPRMKLMPYDVDTVFGQGDSPGSTTASLFRMTNTPPSGADRVNTSLIRFMTWPEFTPIYYATLKKQCDTTFSAAPFNALVDQVLGDWVPQPTRDAMKSWMAGRAAYVLSQIPTNLSIISSLNIVSNFPYTTVSTIALRGSANVIETRQVRVNGNLASWDHMRGSWTNNAVSLVPGINRVLVQTFGTNGAELARGTIDVWYDDGSVGPLSGTIASDTTLTAAGGPYVVSGNVTVPPNVALTLEPGTTLYFAAGVTMTVNGRLFAEGTETRHIRFTRSPAVSSNWGSLDFINATNESRLAFIDIDSCAGTTLGGQAAEIHANNSVVFFDHLTVASVPAQQYLSFDASSFIVQSCVFPTYPAPVPPSAGQPRMVRGLNGIRAGGYGIFRDNYFGHTYGVNDTMDFTGGQRPGAILQVINNIFDGAGDDQLDLDSTDAWIEGNIFMHAHRDPARTDDARDTASAISGGVEVAGQFAEWTVINNLIYDVDHACLSKGGASPGAGRFVFVNNTLVHVAKEGGAGLPADIAAFDFTDDGVALPDPTYGAGAYIAGNIIWDCPALTANYNAANHTVIFENNILPQAWSGPGSNNVVTNPHLRLDLISSVAAADWRTVKAALTPTAGSPARGAGLGGFDCGGLNPRGLLVFGEPESPTHRTTATLTVAPGGTFNWGSVVPPYTWGYTSYRWKLDSGPWSAETLISTSPTISLSGLANGPHTVYVAGRNDAGYYQDDPFVYPPDSGIPAHVTASRTWTVDASLSRLVISEVLARNASTLSIDGEYPDLIELRNAGGTGIDLAGYGLTDDAANPFKFTFDAGTFLEPGDYLVLYADNAAGVGLHLNFGLDGEGDAVHLYAPNGTLLDEVVFGPQLPDLSIARRPDGSWGLARPTFPGPNVAAPVGETRTLKINEWLASGLGIFGDDFVELYNPDPLPVNVGGHFLSDAPQGSPGVHEFLPLSFIVGGGAAAFIADGKPENGGDHLGFKLSPDWGQIGLFAPDLTLIDCIAYGAQSAGVSQGRRPNGAATLAYFSPPTPGAPNPGGSGTVTITISNTVVNLLSLTGSSWRWDNSGTDFGTAWIPAGFDDSGWSNGVGLFGFETTPNVYPFPFNTTIPAPNQTNGHITVYYRAHFQWTNQSGFALYATNYLDDGAVYYINNVEVGRLRVNAGQTYGTLAGNQLTEGTPELVIFATNSLVPGDNVLAVEVHQSTANSSDDVFGLSLAAIRSVTNVVSSSTPLVINEILANNGTLTNADGSMTDLVEVYNPSTNTTDLAGLTLTDDVNVPQKWAFPAGITLAPGAYLVVRCDGGAAPSTNAGPVLNTGFNLNAAGDEVYVFDKPSNGAALLDAVVFGLQASDFSIGRLPNGTGPWVLNLPTPGTANVATSPGNVNNVRFNEWLANPKNGDSDFLELYNPNPQPVAIGGLFLTDDVNDRTKSPIAPLSFIGSFTNGFARFIADNSPAKGANHLDFSLSADGEVVTLFPVSGPAIATVTFGAQVNGVSEGCLPDGSTNIVRFPSTPTPGESNYLPLDDVVINEALTHTDLPLEDAIELFNRSTKSVSVGGWFLSDNTDDLRKYRIPDGTVIGPGQFLVLYEYQFNPMPGFAPNFALSSAHGDQIYLSAADAAGNFTGFRDVVKFDAQENGVSFGRVETTLGVDFVSLLTRSFGMDNPANVAQFRTGTGATNAAVKVGPVVINEIMYHPPDAGTNDNVLDEFIELRNVSAAAVSLYHTNYPTNTWHLRNAVDFNFPTNVSMPANGFLLVVSFNPTNAALLSAFRTKYGVPVTPVYGPYSGKLDNSSDSIELNRPDFPELPPSPDAGFVPRILVDKVKYKDSAPWASLPDGATNGLGYSLQRRVSSAHGNEATNWLAGVPTAGAVTGSAVTNLPGITASPTNLVVPPGFPAAFSVTATGAPPLLYQWRYNGSEILGATNSSFSIAVAQTNHEGRYSVWVANPAGAALSSNATLTIQSPPLITTHPQNQVALAGGTATFTVVAGGSTPLRYQWRKNGGDISNATNASFTINNAQPADQAGYAVVITNIFGSITSLTATLTINIPPGITTQPQPQTVNQGDTATFSVTASGDAPLRYQWRRNGSTVAGATNDTLLLANVQPAQAGNYSVAVSNFVGSVTSSAAPLTVIALPVVTLVATDPNASETGPDTGLFTVTRSFTTNSALTVNLTIGGSAGNGSDYNTLASPVIIPANVASATLLVTPINDPTAESPESVIVVLTSGAGYTIGSPSNATVTISDNDNLTPSVTVTNPADGTLFVRTPTNIVLGATASDTDGTVAKVEFYWQGTNKLGEDLTAPYSITWSNAPAGSNALTSIATDDLGGRGTSAPVYLVLNALPTVSITSPANGATINASNATLNATAADADGSVTLVEFFEGANLLGSDASSPYSFAWNNVPPGTYSLTARATDDRGAVAVSAPVNVTFATVSPVFTNTFANRVTVTGSPVSAQGTSTIWTTGTESGEPTQGLSMSRSGWMGWTAPSSGTVVMDTAGSSYNTTLGVYTGTAVNALTTVAFNDNFNSTPQSQVTINATAGATYQIQIAGVTGSANGNYVFHLAYSNSPPNITTQPQSQTVARGATANFSVTAGGTPPLTYQWRRNGAALTGATSATLALANVQGHQEGTYSVVVSNPYGSATSSGATLTVTDGLYVTQQLRLLTYSNEWRYEQSGTDLGVAWKDPGYNDASWPMGGGLLGFETTPAIYPEPFRTTLDVSNNAIAILTYYFRTHLTLTNEDAGVTFHATNFIDDGAVWYLNGFELARVRMPAGPPSYSTLAIIQNNETTPDAFNLAATNWLVGDNVLAVEVHQTTAGSSDIVFGMELTATISTTNRPVIVNPQVLGNGSFQGTLTGTAGRVYAIDFTPVLGTSWTPLVTFTNVTGQTPFTDPGAASQNPRFYRGRLVP